MNEVSSPTISALYCPARMLDAAIDVTLVGVGGTGSEVMDGLARLHQGLLKTGHPGGLKVTVYDGDKVSPANIGRQRFHDGDIGYNKAEILTHRYNMFHGTRWEARPHRYAPAKRSRRCQDVPDLLVTCVDEARVRARIGKAFRQENTEALWLDFGNASRDGQVVLGHLGRTSSTLRIPNVFDLYPELSTMNDANTPSCSFEEAIESQDLFINRVLADYGVSMLWNLLRHGQLSFHGGYADLARGTISPLGICQETWRFMGYGAAAA